MLGYALREGYHTALMKGQYPITFLFLEMDPHAVDVNVHPAKKEVRFRDGNGVRDAVIEAVSRTLTRAQTTVPGQRVRPAPDRGCGVRWRPSVGAVAPGGRRWCEVVR